jgi:hypothetical protein
MQRFRQETGKSHRAGPVLMSAKNDLAALQENFSFGKSRYIRNDKAAMPIDSRMTHISGFDRCQLSLLPEAIDDYVGSDNPVRFMTPSSDGLDLAAVGF